MIIITDNETGKQDWHKSGSGYTPFTTTNIGRARGELTRCSGRQWCTCKLIKVVDYEDIK